MIEVKIGQKWRDKKSKRVVEVVMIEGGDALIHSVDRPAEPSIWVLAEKFFLTSELVENETGTPVRIEPETFSIGDVVRLKSGGPSMTVGSTPREDATVATGRMVVRVVWHSGEGNLLVEGVPVDILVRAHSMPWEVDQ